MESLSVEERLGRLERQNRILKYVVGSCVLLGVCMGANSALQQAKVPDAIFAKNFVVVEDGETRGGFGINGNTGRPIFTLHNKKGGGINAVFPDDDKVLFGISSGDMSNSPHILLDVNEKSCAATLGDGRGNPRFVFDVKEGKGFTMVLVDINEKGRGRLILPEGGTPQGTLYNSRGQLIWANSQGN